jgi:hypothetical protein
MSGILVPPPQSRRSAIAPWRPFSAGYRTPETCRSLVNGFFRPELGRKPNICFAATIAKQADILLQFRVGRVANRQFQKGVGELRRSFA